MKILLALAASALILSVVGCGSGEAAASSDIATVKPKGTGAAPKIGGAVGGGPAVGPQALPPPK